MGAGLQLLLLLLVALSSLPLARTYDEGTEAPGPNSWPGFEDVEILDVAYDGPPGWRMVDRFSGFRYEVSGNVVGVGFRYAAAQQAESLGCFGWAQNTERNTVVGEARCAKATGPLMKEWLHAGPEKARVDDVEIKDYENTKIKLHFSHFKILPDERITCFHDPPHQCPDFADDYEGEYGDQGCEHDPLKDGCPGADGGAGTHEEL